MPHDGSMSSLFAGVLFALFGIATVTDLLKGKIYNTLTLSFLVAGLGTRLFAEGWAGGQVAFTSFLIATALYFPLWRLRVFTAGDVKLLMAASPWLAVPDLVRLALLTILVGALVGLVIKFQIHLREEKTKPKKKKQLLKMPLAPAFFCAFVLMQIAELSHWRFGPW
jgi:Flp pilus assembly protein protease CpaA